MEAAAIPPLAIPASTSLQPVRTHQAGARARSHPGWGWGFPQGWGWSWGWAQATAAPQGRADSCRSRRNRHSRRREVAACCRSSRRTAVAMGACGSRNRRNRTSRKQLRSRHTRTSRRCRAPGTHRRMGAGGRTAQASPKGWSRGAAHPQLAACQARQGWAVEPGWVRKSPGLLKSWQGSAAGRVAKEVLAVHAQLGVRLPAGSQTNPVAASSSSSPPALSAAPGALTLLVLLQRHRQPGCSMIALSTGIRSHMRLSALHERCGRQGVRQGVRYGPGNRSVPGAACMHVCPMMQS